MATKRVTIVVKGFVQGVFFRVNTRNEASKLGLTGWVKNGPNGTVEAVAEGEEEKLIKLVNWCKKGPPSSRVTDVIVDYGEALNEFGAFEIRYY